MTFGLGEFLKVVQTLDFVSGFHLGSSLYAFTCLYLSVLFFSP